MATRQILNPLIEARDRTRHLLVPSWICFHCTTTGTPVLLLLVCSSLSLHPLPSLISNCLNLPLGTQGRPWRLNEAHFLKTRNRGHTQALGPRSPIGPCLVTDVKRPSISKAISKEGRPPKVQSLCWCPVNANILICASIHLHLRKIRVLSEASLERNSGGQSPSP